MADAPDIPDELLAEIRRAAFELRQSQPQEVVRVFWRVAVEGGVAEVLARGVLGELYFDEFGDFDGAEYEYRKVLAAAPGCDERTNAKSDVDETNDRHRGLRLYGSGVGQRTSVGFDSFH